MPDPIGKGKSTTAVGQTGTLVFDVYPEIKRTSFEDIQQEADEAVDLLVRNSKEPVKTRKGARRVWS